MVFKKQWVAVVVLVGIMVMSLCSPVYAAPYFPAPAPFNPDPEPVIPMPYEPNPDPIIPAPFNPNEEDAVSDPEADSSEKEENKGLLERIIEELEKASKEEKRPISLTHGGLIWWFLQQYGDNIFRAVWGWVVDQAIILGKWVANQVVAAWNWTLNKAYAAWNWTKGKAIAAWNWTKGKAIAAWNWIFDLDTIKLDQVKVTDKQLKQLADLSYKEIGKISEDDLVPIFGRDENGDPKGLVIDRKDLSNGFQAIAVKNLETDEVIIVFRGSDTEDYFIDWWGQNLSLPLQFKGVQVDSAERFVESVMNNDLAKNSRIILTGHSKGGFHSQMMAKKFRLPAVTFNAPGLKPHIGNSFLGPRPIRGAVRNILNPNMTVLRDLINMWGIYDDRVVNYVNKNDFVGTWGVHFGKTVVLDEGSSLKERNDYKYPFKDHLTWGAIKAGRSWLKGGTEQIRYEHGLDPFNGEFGEDGNIAR